MSRCAGESGSALVAALGLALLLAPVGAFVAFQAQADSALLRGVRDGLEGFYAADAGLEHALAEIEPGVSLQSLLHGPDGVAGNGDDGLFPFRGPLAAALVDPPLHYVVRVESLTAGSVRLSSVGSPSRGGAAGSAQVRAVVARASAPFSPAAAYVAGGAPALDLGSGGFVVSGFDHAASDTPGSPSGSGRPVAAFGSGDPTSAAQLSAACDGLGIGPCTQTVDVDVAALAQAALERPERVELSAAGAVAASSLGSDAAPRLTVVNGSYDVEGDVAGAGVLVVRGGLRVAGTLTFDGLVVVQGGVVFETGSRVRVTGALWRDVAADVRLHLLGGGAVVHGAGPLARADAVFPGLLPHAAEVVSWEEVL